MEPWVPKKPAEILTEHRSVSAGKGLTQYTCVHVYNFTEHITKPLQTQRNRPAHRLATDPKLAAATSGTLCNSRRHCATLFAGQTNKANQQHKQC